MPLSMSGWVLQPIVVLYDALYEQQDLLNVVLRVPSSAHAPVSQPDGHASAAKFQRVASLVLR